MTIDTCPFFKYDDYYGEQCILEGGTCRECLDEASKWYQQPCLIKDIFFQMLEKAKKENSYAN